MSFDYISQTREHYKSDSIAQAYHEEYNSSGVTGWRHRFIAQRERAAVRRLLQKIPHASVVDVPTGTGKMAAVFAEFGCSVTAGDVSPNMLDIARQSFEAAGCKTDSFHVIDLEKATETLTERFDAFVCIRLLHRVPDDVKLRMLGQIAQIAPKAIVSFSVTNPWQRVRTSLSRTFFGAKAEGWVTRRNMADTTKLIEQHFKIDERIPVAKVLSSEWVFLLTSRAS